MCEGVVRVSKVPQSVGAGVAVRPLSWTVGEGPCGAEQREATVRGAESVLSCVTEHCNGPCDGDRALDEVIVEDD